MKNISVSAIVAAMLFAMSSVNAYAERGSGLYIGLKTGIMEPDVSGADLDDDNPIIVQGGIDFSGFAAQMEYYAFETQVDNTDIDADFSVLGFYGVYRTPGFAYLMGKAGVVMGDVEIEDYDESDTSLSYGVGAGLNINDMVFAEVEYTIIEIDEVDLDFFGISANLKF